jgi:hypothetical protein
MEIIRALIFLALGVGLYFLPSIIAFSRVHKLAVTILIINFFFGWTLLGWVIALVWACAHIDDPRKKISYINRRHMTKPELEQEYTTQRRAGVLSQPNRAGL